MDFTWPMSGAHDAQDREAGAQKDESTAVDFVVNAWSLLRGLGTERTTVAAASLAAAGEEPSGERNVDFVKQTWALYQQAMDEGWVTEWVEKFCSPDIFLTDGVGRSTPYVVHGHEELCEYYNVVLEKVWDHGKATVTWVPRGFYSMGSIVIAEYDIEVTPKGSSHTRQLWLYHVEGDKLKEIRMYPLNGKSNGMPPPVRPSKKPADKRVRTEAEEMNDAVSCVSMPSLAESIPQNRPGGVALSRPCCHNAWDNVRIKRGWAILRCRICQCQWRLRPTAIPHCTDFARGAGACPRGVECPQLHVHRTRERSKTKDPDDKDDDDEDKSGASDSDGDGHIKDCELTDAAGLAHLQEKNRVSSNQSEEGIDQSKSDDQASKSGVGTKPKKQQLDTSPPKVDTPPCPRPKLTCPGCKRSGPANTHRKFKDENALHNHARTCKDFAALEEDQKKDFREHLHAHGSAKTITTVTMNPPSLVAGPPAANGHAVGAPGVHVGNARAAVGTIGSGSKVLGGIELPGSGKQTAASGGAPSSISMPVGPTGIHGGPQVTGHTKSVAVSIPPGVGTVSGTVALAASADILGGSSQVQPLGSFHIPPPVLTGIHPHLGAP